MSSLVCMPPVLLKHIVPLWALFLLSNRNLPKTLWHLPLSFLPHISHPLPYFFLTSCCFDLNLGFDILLPSYKLKSRFLLTCRKNSWLGFWMVGWGWDWEATRVLHGCLGHKRAPFVVCPAWPSTITLSAISRAFDVRDPAELMSTASNF